MEISEKDLNDLKREEFNMGSICSIFFFETVFLAQAALELTT